MPPGVFDTWRDGRIGILPRVVWLARCRTKITSLRHASHPRLGDDPKQRLHPSWPSLSRPSTSSSSRILSEWPRRRSRTRRTSGQYFAVHALDYVDDRDKPGHDGVGKFKCFAASRRGDRDGFVQLAPLKWRDRSLRADRFRYSVTRSGTTRGETRFRSAEAAELWGSRLVIDRGGARWMKSSPRRFS